MIVETLVSWACSFFVGLFSGFEIVTLPVELISVVARFMEVGVWVVGGDILALFIASVVFWWGVHLSIGLAIWVWDLLPLT